MDSPKSFKAKFSRIMLATAAKNESELARILDIHPSSVGAAKKRTQIPTGWIEKIAEDFSINSDWLFFGRGQMQVNTSPSEQAHASSPPESPAFVPMVEARMADSGEYFVTSESSIHPQPFCQEFLVSKGNPATMVLMRVSGESMAPEICDNDLVLIDRSKTDILPGRIYAVGFEACVYIKQIDMLPGKLVLKSANPNYPPVEAELGKDRLGPFRILGRVLWCGRDIR